MVQTFLRADHLHRYSDYGHCGQLMKTRYQVNGGTETLLSANSYNEPWPTAANNSLLSYPAIPKPAFYEVKNACRPVLASA